MAAELLRRAAAKLREGVSALPAHMDGRWFTRSDAVIADDGTDVGMLVVEPYIPEDDGPLVAFIARAASPPVALCLSVLLERIASIEDAHDRASASSAAVEIAVAAAFIAAQQLAEQILREVAE